MHKQVACSKDQFDKCMLPTARDVPEDVSHRSVSTLEIQNLGAAPTMISKRLVKLSIIKYHRF